jgi:hypothetical protein
MTAILENITVIDAHGEWLSQWTKQFAALSIPFLRSAMDVHPAPFDSEAMKAFTKHFGREDEIVDLDFIDNSTDYRQGSFRVPGTPLFGEFCQCLVKMYGIEQAVTKGTCTRVVPVHEGGDPAKPIEYCQVFYEDGSGETVVVNARRVVLAMGPTTVPRVPDWASEFFEGGDTANLPPISHAWGLVHQSEPVDQATPVGATSAKTETSTELTEPDPAANAAAVEIQPKMVGTEGVGWGQFKKRFGHSATSELAGQNILVVGGGLTSAHLCHRAVSRGSRKVTLVSRRKLKVKQFDLDLKWLGWRHRPGVISKFLTDNDLTNRMNMIREARGGGSVTPEAHAMLSAEVEDGRLELLEGDEVIGADRNSGKWSVDFENGETRQFDQIWLATGSDMDATKQPLLSQLLADCPIDIIGGLPALHPSLRWRLDCPVFIMGAFAALQLGPDALNLGTTSLLSLNMKSRICSPNVSFDFLFACAPHSPAFPNAAGSRTGSCRVGFSIRESLREAAKLKAVAPVTPLPTTSPEPEATLEPESAPMTAAAQVEEGRGGLFTKKQAKFDIEQAKRLEGIRVTYSRGTGMVYVKFAKARSATKGKRKHKGRKGRSRKKDGGKCKCSSHTSAPASKK